MGRLQSIAKKCAVHGGDCPCELHECKARLAIMGERGEIDKQFLELCRREEECNRIVEFLNRKPATVRPDWTMPVKPPGDYQPVVVNDDGWSPGWHSGTEKEDWIEISGDAAWPFVEDTAWSRDWARLGFRVE